MPRGCRPGMPLAVDRHQFSRLVTARLLHHPLLTLRRRLVDELPAGPCILAGGPLVDGGRRGRCAGCAAIGCTFMTPSRRLSKPTAWTGIAALSPARQASASGQPLPPPPISEGDYINCPMSRAEYEAFVAALLDGRKVSPHRFEEPRYFEGCLPIEVMAERGPDTLAFGPMKPVGLVDPNAVPGAEKPYAIVQLRAENRFGTAYNPSVFRRGWPIPIRSASFR